VGEEGSGKAGGRVYPRYFTITEPKKPYVKKKVKKAFGEG